MRLFIAVELPGSVREKLEQIQQRLKGTRDEIKWVNPSLIHLTMKFLGEVKEKELESIVRVIRSIASRFSHFGMKIEKIGTFPFSSSPRVIWVGVGEGKDKLEVIAGELEQELAKQGFSRERRKWISHLTLGRVKNLKEREKLKELVSNYKEVEIGEVKVRDLSVIQSRLTPQGAIYTVLERVPFQNVNRI